MKKEKKTMYSVRLMTIIIGILIPMNLITLLLCAFEVQSMVTQLKENTAGTLRVYVSQIDASLAAATARSIFMSQDNVDSVYMASRAAKSETDYERDLQASVRLSNEFNDYLHEDNRPAGMYAVYPRAGDYVIVDNRYSYSKTKDAIWAYLNERAVSERDMKQWECVRLGDEARLCYMYRYKNGYYGVWFDLEYLLRTMKIPVEDDLLALTDDNGSILFATDSVKELCGEEAMVLQETIKGYEKISEASANSPLVMTRCLSIQKALSSGPALFRVMLFLSVLFLFALPVILHLMNNWIIRPVRKLDEAMEQISLGNMDYRIAESGQMSEFERINRTFNHMMEDVSRLKIDVYEEQLEKQHIRLKFLSQQIQPHFILNTLNILYSYERDEYPLIQKMILCLSRYFRYIVNANEDEVPLRAEMDHIRNYLEIQQARYPDTFFYSVEYEEGIGGCMVPPLLIQNFAENSIKHSIKIGNHIDIYVLAERYGEDKVRVRMIDTGQGIDQELIDQIEEFQRTGVRQKGLGVGIQNAIERLKVLYGADTEFKISRDKPHGTRIEIMLPLKLGEEEEDE